MHVYGLGSWQIAPGFHRDLMTGWNWNKNKLCKLGTILRINDNKQLRTLLNRLEQKFGVYFCQKVCHYAYFSNLSVISHLLILSNSQPEAQQSVQGVGGTDLYKQGSTTASTTSTATPGPDENWDNACFTDAEISSAYHQLALPLESVTVVDSVKLLDRCMVHLTKPGTIVGIDSEWRPAFCGQAQRFDKFID